MIRPSDEHLRWLVAEASVAALDCCTSTLIADVVRGYYPEATQIEVAQLGLVLQRGLGSMARLVEQRRDKMAAAGRAAEPQGGEHG